MLSQQTVTRFLQTFDFCQRLALSTVSAVTSLPQHQDPPFSLLPSTPCPPRTARRPRPMQLPTLPVLRWLTSLPPRSISSTRPSRQELRLRMHPMTRECCCHRGNRLTPGFVLFFRTHSIMWPVSHRASFWRAYGHLYASSCFLHYAQ